MIETFELTKRYDDGTIALNSLTMKLDSKISCLIGRNGAGKTTLTRILSTQLKPTSGKAVINGYDIERDRKTLRKKITSIPQEAKPMGIASPLEHVTMYLTAKGMSFRDAVREAKVALEAVGLGEVIDKPTDELSGGMKRKIFVAMAISSNTDVVFLDEPTTGLDPISRMEVWSAVREIRSKILLTTHYMEEAQELCGQIAILDRGKLRGLGTVNELLEPLKGKVRVEGMGDIIIGKTRLSYVDKTKASELLDKNVTLKPITLEDVFITMGVEIES
ncbi:multidrug ABC transporter ATP-binding protein [Sulfolobales archaeon HS-7]|nr:multidrug ABC transporter ATP-binding protein [Sulfolobales archaeon HS-7]